MTYNQQNCPQCGDYFYGDSDDYCQTCGYEFTDTDNRQYDYNIISGGKEYMVLEIKEIIDELSDEGNLLAMMAEIVTDADNYKSYSATTGDYFITKLKSKFARYLISNVDDVKSVDMRLFDKRNISINNESVTAFCDNEINFM